MSNIEKAIDECDLCAEIATSGGETLHFCTSHQGGHALRTRLECGSSIYFQCSVLSCTDTEDCRSPRSDYCSKHDSNSRDFASKRREAQCSRKVLSGPSGDNSAGKV